MEFLLIDEIHAFAVNGDKGIIVIEEDSIVQWSIEGEETPEELVLGHANMSSASNPANFGIEGAYKTDKRYGKCSKVWSETADRPVESRKPIETIMAIYESSKTHRMIEL